MEPPVVKESDQAFPKVLNLSDPNNPNDESASNSVPAASEVDVDKNENLNPSSSKNIEKTNDLIDQEHFSGDGSDRSNSDGDDEDGESPVVDVDAQTLVKEKLADETLAFDKKLGTFMSIVFEKDQERQRDREDHCSDDLVNSPSLASGTATSVLNVFYR